MQFNHLIKLQTLVIVQADLPQNKEISGLEIPTICLSSI